MEDDGQGTRAALTVFTTVMATVVLYWFCRAHPELFVKGGGIERFQTLIAGVLAIGGGFFVYDQTRTNLRMERRREALKGFAARSTLPHLLDRVTRYAEEVINVLNEIRAQSIGGVIKHGAVFNDPPALDYDLIEKLAWAVETLNEEQAKNFLSTLLKHLQILNAQTLSAANGIRGLKRRRSIVGADNIDAAALTAGIVYRIASNLFEYARRESNFIPKLTNEGILSGLHTMDYECVKKPDFSYRRLYSDLHAEWVED